MNNIATLQLRAYTQALNRTLLSSFPSGNEIFFHESRRSINLTAGICVIFRGLNFESNEESGKKSRFRTETSSNTYLSDRQYCSQLGTLRYSIGEISVLSGFIEEQAYVLLQTETKATSTPFPGTQTITAELGGIQLTILLNQKFPPPPVAAGNRPAS